MAAKAKREPDPAAVRDARFFKTLLELDDKALLLLEQELWNRPDLHRSGALLMAVYRDLCLDSRHKLAAHFLKAAK